MNEKEIAIEAKGSNRLRENDLRGMHALDQDGKCKRKIIVNLEKERRIIAGVEVLPLNEFVEELWAGEIF